MDDFMRDFRVEERSYAREIRSLTASKKSMIMQERLFFRNIPLSNWIEHEMIVEEGRDLDQLPKESVFTPAAVAAPAGLAGEGRLPSRLPISKTIEEFDAPAANSAREGISLIHPRAVAFGAQ